MAQQRFFAEYRKLNPDQKKAVDSIEGPVMVLAGPGTGKTQILTLRIANILRKTDTPPDAILALTFTESGVFSMRKRLVHIIGSGGYRVGIHTFHSFCNDVIRTYPDAFPRIIGARHMNDVERFSLLKECIASSSLSKLKPFGNAFFYLHPIAAKISELKQDNAAPPDVAETIAKQRRDFHAIPDLVYQDGVYAGRMKGVYAAQKKRIDKNEELLAVYQKYERELRERNVYDYDDMILETIQALLRNPDVLLELQETYHYFLADEHQDANRAQNRLLELLASYHASPNLFVVGDEKQAIFRFQGASLDNFLYFTKRYPDAPVITLSHNYRSTQSILDAAGSMIAKRAVPHAFANELATRLVAAGRDTGTPIEVRAFSHPEHELLFLADAVRRAVDEGVPPSEIAVLYRTNHEAEAVAHVFEKRGIPFVIESSQNILADPFIRKLIILVRAVHDFGDDRRLVDALHLDILGLEPLDIYRLISYARRRGLSLYGTLKSKRHRRAAGIEHERTVDEFYRRLASLRTLAANNGILVFLERLLEESGLLAAACAHERAAENIEKLNRFFAEMRALVETKRSATLSDCVAYLALLEEHNIFLKSAAREGGEGRVRLMTAHKAKGLEFDYVYLIHVADGIWGNRRSVTHFDIPTGTERGDSADIDDERRLFYVALTRARVGVFLSYARENERGAPALPFQCVEEIGDGHLRVIPTAPFEKTAQTEVFLHPPAARPAPAADKAFLNRLFQEQGLSVTALNNYLSCPWKYFYNNLLRIPQAPVKHLMFGTAAHAALRYFFDRWREDGDIGAEGLVTMFRDYARAQPFHESDFEDALKKGEAALRGYYEARRASWPRNIINEFKVDVLLPRDEGRTGGLRLRGTLDKVELLAGRDVNVVDYKTGAPKSRNHIEGATKTSTGDFKRQLVFYRLLLDHYDRGRFSMVSGEIDFIEPARGGKYRAERFAITGEEVRAVRSLALSAAREIEDLAFWDRACADAKCPYCALHAMTGLAPTRTR
ncbi:MAG: ATP-dependent helicase [Parcubacteria group bacterium]|nr:ATP-dependent helicase [Parcubacteria group bacterium]